MNPYTGDVRWALATRSSLFSSPAVTATHVVVTDSTGHVYGMG
ncbi:PQQ-binding-like beta-propeller repeat protein [Streptomyces caeruleatus]